MVTLFTVGYGDIVPVSISEKVFSIFSSIICVVIFGYILNRLGQVFTDIDDRAEEIKYLS
jgi:hypothetical protein